MSRFTQEFFYEDANGQQQDAELHTDILAGANPPPAVDVAKSCGLTDKEIAALFNTGDAR